MSSYICVLGMGFINGKTKAGVVLSQKFVYEYI